MPKTLADHFADIEAEYAALVAEPLSTRKTLLVACLIDNFADRAFEALRDDPEKVFHAPDVLAYRQALRDRSPELGLIFDLCATPPRARLELKAVKVPFAEYGKLRTEDFMVSIYNGNTVQRVVLVGADGGEWLALRALQQAIIGLTGRVRRLHESHDIANTPNLLAREGRIEGI
jgi:hypothetical protein